VQALQDVALLPALGWYWPAGQAKHLLSCVAPPVQPTRYSPAGQDETVQALQDVALLLAPGWYWPAGQGKHLLSCVAPPVQPTKYSPAGQDETVQALQESSSSIPEQVAQYKIMMWVTSLLHLFCLQEDLFTLKCCE
jgi:hypothetical protein